MKKLLFFLILFSPFYVPAQVIVTAVGTGTAGFAGDNGLAFNAELNHPYGVALDDSGNLYICDEYNSCIRKVSPGYGGIIKTIAGNGNFGYSGDGGLGIYAQLHGNIDVAVDHRGNVYIADADNNVIRKVTPLDTITTIAGTSVAGYNGDGIAATSAQLNSPTGIAVDNLDNIYIADDFNYRIRKVDTAGIITTIAGTGIAGFSADGSMADTVNLNYLLSIRVDKKDNLFFADNARIRKIDTAGIITTIAGNGIGGYSGDNGLATAAEIHGGIIALDTNGILFIADAGNNRIREVDTSGIIYTIVDSDGYSGFSGDNGDPLLAKLEAPQGIVVDNSGDIYIGDVGNNRVRLVTKHPLGVTNLYNQKQKVNVFPNPCQNYFTVRIISAVNEQVNAVIENVTGIEVDKFEMSTNQPFTIQFDWPPGVYIIHATTSQQNYTQKIIVE